MEPTLRNGEEWLVTPGRIKPGRIVVFPEPDRMDLVAVKRIIRRSGVGWWVEGDNPDASRDSRHFGLVPHAHIIGVLRRRLR